MQAAQIAPASPATPALPGTPQGISAQTQLDGLYASKAELQKQLDDMYGRREELYRQRQRMSESSGKPLEARIAQMDARAAKLEEQLATTNDRIAALLATGVTTPNRVITTITPSDARFMQRVHNEVQDAVMESLAISGSVLLGFYVLWRGFRRIFRKKTVGATTQAAVPDYAPHIQQLQQSMDAIAIEVERISEAQRYSAKLLKEKVRVE